MHTFAVACTHSTWTFTIRWIDQQFNQELTANASVNYTVSQECLESKMVGKKSRRADAQPAGRCVDNRCAIVDNLSQLYLMSDMSDVELKVGFHIFKAHRVVLSMTSSVFKTMLMDSKWSDAQKYQIPLFEEPECEVVFHEFLAYMYSGRIVLTNVNVLPVVMLADKYDVSTLSKECLMYMQSHCAAYPQHIKVVSWFQYATLCSYDKLVVECANSIKHNFDSVIHSDDFVTMRLNTLESLLHSDDLVVADEYTLYKAVERWLLRNTETLEFCGVLSCRKNQQEKKLLSQLMSYIRFPLMEASELAHIESSNFYQRNFEMLEMMLRLGWISHMLGVKSPV